MVAKVRVQLLGRFEVSVDGAPVPDAAWRRRHAAGLVKLLALAPRATLHREQVLDALWPELSPAQAAPRFHKAAHYARRALGDGALAVEGELVRLGEHGGVEVDAVTFTAEAEAALDEGTAEAALRALRSWAGTLLPGDLYERWTETWRERLDALHARLLRQGERWDELVVLDPTDEASHLALMRSMAAAGDHRGAVRQFERLDRALRRELGVAPSAEAVAMRDELQRAGAPELPPAAAPGELPSAAAAALTQAGAGRRSGLFVVGASTAATAAVLDSLARRASGDGWRVGRSGAAAVEGAWPYAPVLEALADLCRAHPALLDGLDDALRAQVEFALAGGEPRWQGDAAHRRLFVAAAELLRLAAGTAGAVLLVDDVHEADDGSLRLLHHLVRAAADQRALVVVSHRPARPGSTLADVRASLAARGATAEVVLEDAADGAERRAAAAVAALPVELRGVLQRVAVSGSTFDTDLFVCLSGLDERAAFDLLDAALESGTVEATSSGYRLAGHEVRDALRSDLPPHRLRSVHRQVADRLAAMGASPARVAHHLLEAGDAEAAVPHALVAVRSEAALGAYRDALALLDSIRGAATGSDAAAVAALRAELLAASADTRAMQAYREAIERAAPGARRDLVAGLARTAVMAGDLQTAQAALAVDAGGPPHAGILLATANLAYLTGDHAAAAAAADEARSLLVDGDPSWQALDLVAVQGLLAHDRGEWFERLRLELRRTQQQPDLARAVFDGHLCVAEYLLYGPTPYDEVIELALSLKRTAARSGAVRAEAFAAALAGEAALLSGRLGPAADHLQEAVELHREVGAAAGEAHSLQRLAEVRLAEGQRETAHALLLRALRLARWSTLSLHLLQRIYGTMIAAATDPVRARAIVDRAAAETGVEDVCRFCQVMLEVPAAIACAKAGDVVAARAHLELAELSARMWDGTAWEAALDEARAHLAAAGDSPGDALGLLESAAAGFDVAGQPLDAQRCRAAASAAAEA